MASNATVLTVTVIDVGTDAALATDASDSGRTRASPVARRRILGGDIRPTIPVGQHRGDRCTPGALGHHAVDAQGAHPVGATRATTRSCPSGNRTDAGIPLWVTGFPTV